MPGEIDQTKWVGTRKVYPAIADLQAIEDNIGLGISVANQDCSVSRERSSDVVLANDIWVITNMVIYNETSLCDMIINVRLGGVKRVVKGFKAYDPDTIGSWDGLLVLAEDDRITFQWLLGGATDTLKAAAHGYKIGVY